MYAQDIPLVTSPHLSWFQHREALYLYHDLFGYILQMSPDIKAILDHFATACTGADALTALNSWDPRVLDDHIETFSRHECLIPVHHNPLDDLHGRYPVKARWRAGYHVSEERLEVVVGPRPEIPPQRLVLVGFELALWKAIDGEKSVAELASMLAKPHGLSEAMALHRATDAVVAWTHSSCQLTRISTAPVSFFRGHIARPHHLDSTMPYAPVEEGEAESPGPMIDLGAYHQETIEDADAQFDTVETTLSHLFREPHPALGGDTYAGRIVAALAERGWWDPPPREILEVGGGVGYFAKGLLQALDQRHPEVASVARYRILDLSPALQQSQKKHLGGRVGFILGNGEGLEGIEDASVSLLISNEVIADMRTARLRHDAIESEAIFDPEDFDEEAFEAGAGGDIEGPEEAVAAIEVYGLDVSEAPEHFLLNLGAIRFLEAIWRGLAPGGHALLTEFGDRWRFPVESTHLDHAEVSIHFGQLEQVARSLGFAVEYIEVPELLGLEHGHLALVSTRAYYRNLTHLFASRGVSLRKLAYTREQLEALCAQAGLELEQVEVLHWKPIEARTMGLEPYDFKALLLSKP